VFLLVPAYPGSPGPKAVKRLVCVCVCVLCGDVNYAVLSGLIMCTKCKCAAFCYRCSMICVYDVSVCLTITVAVPKWMNRLRCSFGCRLGGPKKPCVKWAAENSVVNLWSVSWLTQAPFSLWPVLFASQRSHGQSYYSAVEKAGL